MFDEIVTVLPFGTTHADTQTFTELPSDEDDRLTSITFRCAQYCIGVQTHFLHDVEPRAKHCRSIEGQEYTLELPEPVVSVELRSGLFVDSVSFRMLDGHVETTPTTSRGGSRHVVDFRPGFELAGCHGGFGGHLHIFGVSGRRCRRDIRSWAHRLRPEERAVLRTILLIRARHGSVWYGSALLCVLQIFEYVVDRWYPTPTTIRNDE